MNAYRYEATSIAGFVQQVAVSYLPNGYHHFVLGRIPQRKDPRAVDRKLIERYDIAVSKWTGYRRKRAGQASIQYLRFERTFLLLATNGSHHFFEDEANVIRNAARGQPIHFAGYSIGYYNGKASVRLSLPTYRQVRGELLRLSIRIDASALEHQIRRLPFEPYAPVCRQLYSIVRAVNRMRKTAGLDLVDWKCVRTRRRVVQALRAADIPLRNVA